MHLRSRRRHAAQRGQAVPIAALFSMLLLGGAALAVDLSLQTDHHLDLQNATDAAALVAARDLGQHNGGLANQADRNTAAIDALRVVYDHLKWGSAGTTWATSAVGSTCGNGTSGSDCHVKVTGPGANSNVTVEVDVPPRNAHNTSYNEVGTTGTPWGYAEVDVSETDRTNFGTAVGFSKDTAGAHSVGYHYPASQPFGFALYSGTVVSGGNNGQVVQGNVYAYRDLQPQSNGQFGFCAGNDTNGNPGNIVLGSPQSGAFPSPDPAAGAPYQYQVSPTDADQITHLGSCSTGASAKHVAQTAQLGQCGNLVVQGVTLSTTQDSRSLACMANPPVTPPDLQGPSLSGNVVYENGANLGNNQSVLTVTTPLAQGLYYVTHNPNCAAPSCTDVVIDGIKAQNNCSGTYASSYNVCMQGVTFWLDQGATIGVLNGAKVLVSPYQPPNDTSLDPNDGRFAVYAPEGSAAGIYESNVSSVLAMTGTVYMPSGTMSVGQNAILYITGQAVVNSWQVQSGNFQNPEVVYDPNAAATQREVLQLVE